MNRVPFDGTGRALSVLADPRRGTTVGTAVALLAAAIATVVGGCSSQPSAPTGALPPGTAHLSIDGAVAVTSQEVRCTVNENLTTLTVADGTREVVTAMVSSGRELAVDWVRIHDLTGFTGGYERGLGGHAQVTMAGPMYSIKGDAHGLLDGTPELTTKRFEFNVSC